MRFKRLELWWRKNWIRLLVRLMRRPSTAHPDWDAGPTRVLFLRHDRVGDMIVSTGVMRAIARSHSTISLDVLASPLNAPVIARADYVSDVIVFDKRRLSSYLATIRRLRRARYDAVIDCMVTAPSVTTLLLVLASGARYRIGIAGRGNDAAFNVPVAGITAPDTHMVDRLAALARAFRPELDAEERHPLLDMSSDELARANAVWTTGGEAGEHVLVNISAGGVERLWPEDRYVAVLRHLRSLAASAVVRVIAAPADSGGAERIAHEGGGVFVKTGSIRDALALVATADFVFTPDTSIAHAVSAFRKPSVAIYGKGSRPSWALYGTPGESVEHSIRGLTGLPIEPVIDAVDRVWNGMTVSRRG